MYFYWHAAVLYIADYRVTSQLSIKRFGFWAHISGREKKIVDRQTRKNNLDNHLNSENNIIFTRSFFLHAL